MANEEVVDDFDTVFGEAAAAAEKQVQEAKPEVKEEATKEPAKEEGKEEPAQEKEQEKEEVKEPDPAADEAVKKAAEEAAAKVNADKRLREEALARVTAENEVRSRQAAEEKAKQEAVEKAAAAKVEAEKATAPYEMTPEEKEADEKFRINFPDEYKATQTLLKQMRREIEAQVYKTQQDVVQRVNKDISPLIETAAERDALAHASAIRTAHSDFDSVIAKYPDWIKTQPAHMQPGYSMIYEQGTTQQVIALVDDMKKSLGVVKSSGAPPAKEKPTPSAAEVAALAPVQSGRATPNQKGAPDKDDFEAAFNEAAAKKD